jgi:hypothetical protein
MTMMRSIGPYLRRLLPAAVVLLTVSCGTSVPGATGSGATGPGPTATPATPAKSATPGATATPAPSVAPSGTATRSPGATAVIFGVIQASPACSVDRVYHACRPRPLGHVEVQARSPSAGVMASALTEADGHYSLRLGPGSYLLVVVITQVLPRCPHVPVSVGSGAAIRANINCDTGIRRLGPPATNPA